MEFNFSETKQEIIEKDVTSSKFLAQVFGYMFIGLLITAVVAFGWNFILQKICFDGTGALTDSGSRIIITTSIVSIVGMLLISFLISILSIFRKKAPWFGFILYAVFVGLAFTVLLIAGISVATVAEAFGITALAFGSMFLIGYFTKSKLNWFAFAAIGLGIGILLTSIFWGVFYLISPKDAILLDWVISLAIIAFEMIVVAADAYNIKKIATKGETNTNLALFCAFNMYCDFIVILIRIVAILARSKNE